MAQDAVARWYWQIDTLSVNSIPADYRHRMNFYYYWRPGKTADMCNGCAGTLPDTFWADANFADTGAILFPPKSYGHEYAGGCADMVGPYQSHFKASGYAGWGRVMVHESGHAVFGLTDTYCGHTGYHLDYPVTNVWQSEDECRSVIQASGGDPGQCRAICSDGSWTTNWKWDPDPDLMNDHWNGMFGQRDVGKINYIFQTWT